MVNDTTDLDQDPGTHAMRRALIAEAVALKPNEMRELCTLFYNELLRRYPAMQSYFAKMSMDRQALKLASAFRLLLDYISDPPRLGALILQTSQFHIGRNITRADYMTFIRTLADVLSRSQSRFPPDEAHRIWIKELEPVVDLMTIWDKGPS